MIFRLVLALFLLASFAEAQEGSRVPPSPSLSAVVSRTDVWSLGAPFAQYPGTFEILRNGKSEGGAHGSKIVLCNGVVYVLGSRPPNTWYTWKGVWADTKLATMPCDPPAFTESPDNTRVPPALVITDSKGGLWDLVPDPAGKDMMVLYCKSRVYKLTDGLWLNYDDATNFFIGSTSGMVYNTLNLSAYMTSLVPTSGLPGITANMWFDDIVVSTQPIAMEPGLVAQASSPTTPMVVRPGAGRTLRAGAGRTVGAGSVTP